MTLAQLRCNADISDVFHIIDTIIKGQEINIFAPLYRQPIPATAILFVDWCQFGSSWTFGLKIELMACAELVGGTTEKICIFTDLI